MHFCQPSADCFEVYSVSCSLREQWADSPNSAVCRRSSSAGAGTPLDHHQQHYHDARGHGRHHGALRKCRSGARGQACEQPPRVSIRRRAAVDMPSGRSCRTQGAHTSAIAASVDRVPHQCLQHHCMVMGETEGAAGSGRRASKAQSL